MKHYKRQWRELSDEHKQKLSQSAAGKPKSAEHRAHFCLKRSRIATQKAFARALSPESRADEGVRSRNARIFA